MNTYIPQSGRSSTVPSIADLDGYSFPSNEFYNGSSNYLSPEHDEFGFDPPEKSEHHKTELFSPANLNDGGALSSWPAFERDDDQTQRKSAFNPGSLLSDSLPPGSVAVSRYGQVTPPRSNSANSVDFIKQEDQLSSKSSTRKKNKSKLDHPPPSSPDSKVSRKRKTYRKSDTTIPEEVDNVEDEKRKTSLEKNRLAAAKCRVNKKEKTEALQRDSHDKAVQNAFLKETVVRMKEEIQHINALLIAHASSEACKRPEELHKHLSQVGQDYFSHHHMGIEGQTYSTYANLARQIQQQSISTGGGGRNFPSDSSSSSHDDHHQQQSRQQRQHSQHLGTAAGGGGSALHLSNPPLPEFNQTADFDVRTPQLE